MQTISLHGLKPSELRAFFISGNLLFFEINFQCVDELNDENNSTPLRGVSFAGPGIGMVTAFIGAVLFHKTGPSCSGIVWLCAGQTWLFVDCYGKRGGPL